MNRYARSARPVSQWLEEQAGLDAVLPKVERLAALQSDVNAYCASVYCGTTTAREGAHRQLVWLARSPAQAAKLRNLKSGLEEFLTHRGWDFSNVVIRLQPDQTPNDDSVTQRTPPPKPGVPNARLSEWERLANTLDDGPLRESLMKFVEHHRASNQAESQHLPKE
ncbi:MAG TPA: hypothetical protein VFS42_09105 [Burkholderiaceae bacterium]|nr:hypothetical protein [Burkholderiaceae bacterium]